MCSDYSQRISSTFTATVSKAIEKPLSKFVLAYESSSAAQISKLHGIPLVVTVSGKILLAKKIEQQTHLLMAHYSQVLGENGNAQLDGYALN